MFSEFGRHITGSKAASILGFAIVGGTSHQASLARIGLKLVQRGHKFTLLLNSEDELSHARLACEPFRSLNVLNFSGQAGVGTQQWRTRIPRDPAKVYINSFAFGDCLTHLDNDFWGRRVGFNICMPQKRLL